MLHLKRNLKRIVLWVDIIGKPILAAFSQRQFYLRSLAAEPEKGQSKPSYDANIKHCTEL